MKTKTIGCAKRIQVEMPLGAQRSAWDCRPFGFGRIVAPVAPLQIELEPGTCLDLSTGEIQRMRSSIAA